jgi:hypothetical protein
MQGQLPFDQYLNDSLAAKQRASRKWGNKGKGVGSNDTNRELPPMALGPRVDALLKLRNEARYGPTTQAPPRLALTTICTSITVHLPFCSKSALVQGEMPSA